jgi:hypothetical protein
VTVVTNELRTGFKVTDDVRRIYWGGGNVVWRIFDPLGFELEIASANLMAIIQVCGIEEGGFIPGKCCWGRDGSVNVLLHEKSDVYVNAFKNAENLKPTKAKSRVVGAKYVLQSGESGIYLGKFQTHAVQYADCDQDEFVKISTLSQKAFAKLRTEHVVDEGIFEAVAFEHGITLYKNAPIVLQADGETILGEGEIQELIKKNTTRFAANNKYSKYTHIARKKGGPIVFALKPISQATFEKIRNNIAYFIDSKSGFNYLFYDSCFNNLVGFVEDGTENVFWSSSEKIYGGNYPYGKQVFTPIQLNGGVMTSIHSVDFAYYRHNPLTLKDAKSFELRNVPEDDNLLSWLDAQYSKGLLRELVLEEQIS